MCSVSSGNTNKDLVLENLEISTRDQSVDIFPALGELYKANTAAAARKSGIKFDKSPDEMVAWISWNNVTVLNDYDVIRRGSKSLCLADNLLTTKYRNTAHRSSYWSSNLSNLSASVISPKPVEGRVFCSRPSFLKYRAALMRQSIIERLAKTCGCSKKAVREELLPSLISIQDSNGDDFSISISLGLSPEEHAAICGLKVSHRSVKELMERYSHDLDIHSTPLQDETFTPVHNANEIIESEVESNPKGQQKLF